MFKEDDEFADLSNEFKDAVAGSTPSEIKQKMSQVTAAQMKLQAAKAGDLDLQGAKIEYDKLVAPYKSRKTDAKQAGKVASAKGDPEETANQALALYEAEEEEKDDEDVQKAKETYNEAGAVYREGDKENKLKLKFCILALQDKGAA